ncbi:type I polyketide synthase, partial [Streptomyces sp. NPDC054841]
AEPVSDARLDALYDGFAAQGLLHGSLFQGLRAAWQLGDEVYAEVALPEGTATDGFGIHPALLDTAVLGAALTVGAAAGIETSAAADTAKGDVVEIPVAWDGVVLYATGASVVRVRITPTDEDADGRKTVAVALADETGSPVMVIESVARRPLSPEAVAAVAPVRRGILDDGLFHSEWAPLSNATPIPGTTGPTGSDNGWGLLGEAPTKLPLDGTPVYSDLEEMVADGMVPAVVLTAFGAAAARPGTGRVAATGSSIGSPVESANDDGDGAVADVDAVRAAAHRALDLVQRWLADDRFARSRLVLLTRGAVATEPDEDITDLGSAAVWGLVRSAQSENPDRMVLLDHQDGTDNGTAFTAADLAAVLASGEPELAVRDGRVFVRRLAHVPAGTDAPDTNTNTNTSTNDNGGAGGDTNDNATASTADPAPALDPSGTALITGGTGTLGALMARHLVTEHGLRHLLLTSRRGDQAEGAAELVAELSALGAHVEVAACDVADRGALEILLKSIPAERPLTAVVHAAGVIDDGLVTSLTPERLDRVLGPKVDAALHLHELTREAKLAEFVLYSSAAATFGEAGQGNYVTANTFLDALAQHRCALGLPATSLQWGFWAPRSGVSAHLTDADLQRIERGGMRPLSAEDGMRLFEVARAAGRPVVAPMLVDVPTLLARDADSALLRGLRRRTAGSNGAGAAGGRRTTRSAVTAEATGAAGDALAERLASLSAKEQEDALLELVRTHVAAVLGHGETGGPIGPDRAFKELGFDSLTAVELRNRLGTDTALRLSATLVFDHPTPAALARHLHAELLPDADGRQPSNGMDPEEGRLRAALATIPLTRFREAGVLDLLMELADLGDGTAQPKEPDQHDAIDAMDTEHLIRMALGNSDS